MFKRNRRRDHGGATYENAGGEITDTADSAQHQLKPWLAKRRPRNERIGRMLPGIAMGIGCALAIGFAILGYTEVPKHTYTEIWYDDFSKGFDLEHSWNREVSVGGYGQTTFDWTTDFDNNSFVKDGKLYLYPELTQWPLQVNGSSLNLTEIGSCTLPYTRLDCFTIHNDSTAQIINPVQSARLNTKGKRGLRFGKIEIRAKMPRGRYLWPAIWMLPTDNVYGIWPASGEIDMFEGHGFDPAEAFSFTGSNCMMSSVHWAPVGQMNWATFKDANHLSCWPRQSLTEDFHTYAMEWTPQGIHMYIDNPLYKMYSIDFKDGPFVTAQLPLLDEHGGVMDNPWRVSPLKAAPLDQTFYVVINVAVGGVNGWFPDDVVVNAPYSYSHGGQPYQAMRDFWEAQHQWYPSWPQGLDRAMAIDWVRYSSLDKSDYWESLPSARLDAVGE